MTRRGRPVARIVPAQPSGERQLTPEQEAAHARTMTRLRKGWDLGGGSSIEAADELYDDEFSLDANILVYAADLAAGDAPRARPPRYSIGQCGRDCVVTLQALAEFFHATTANAWSARTEAAARCGTGQPVSDVIS